MQDIYDYIKAFKHSICLQKYVWYIPSINISIFWVYTIDIYKYIFGLYIHMLSWYDGLMQNSNYIDSLSSDQCSGVHGCPGEGRGGWCIGANTTLPLWTYYDSPILFISCIKYFRLGVGVKEGELNFYPHLAKILCTSLSVSQDIFSLDYPKRRSM